MSSRGLVAIGVLGAWGAGLALFARRELSRSEAERLADVAIRVSPGATWFAVERDGRHVGFASLTIDTIPRELQVTEYLVADTGVGAEARYTEQTIVRLSRALALHRYDGTRARGRGTDTVRLAGSLVDDSTLAFAVERGTRTDSGEVAVTGPLFLPQLVPLVAVLRDRPRVGRSRPLAVFDPDRGASSTLEVRFVAESLFVVTDSAVADQSSRWLAVHRDTVRAWRLASAGDAGLDVWVDQLGQVVWSRRRDGLVLRRTAFELAFENWRLANPSRVVAARAGGDIVSGTLLGSGAPVPTVVLDSLRVRVRAAPPRSLTTRLGPQFRTNLAWTTIATPEHVTRARYRLPTEARWRRAFTANLRAEPRIEVSDPAIVHLAERLRGDESDPAIVVRSVLRWLRDSTVADGSMPPASAAGTLARRRGDANEFARLLVALSRAAGVPARGVSGLLHAGGRLFYHAWAEVYLGRWVGVDPLLGQMPVDAAHLPVMYDALDAQAELMRVLARLDLAIVAAYPRAP